MTPREALARILRVLEDSYLQVNHNRATCDFQAYQYYAAQEVAVLDIMMQVQEITRHD